MLRLLLIALFVTSTYSLCPPAYDEEDLENGYSSNYPPPDANGHVTIPEGVTDIPEWKYAACAALKTLTLPSTLQTIQTGAFSQSGLNSAITIPDSVTSIKMQAFQQCKITSVSFGSSVQTLGKEAFAWNDITSVGTLPDSMTCCSNNIKTDGSWNQDSQTWSEGFEGAFKNNDITSINIPAGFTSLPYNWVVNNKIAALPTIPTAITVLPDNAFANNPIVGDVVIPNHITSIGASAFSQSQMTSITIPDSVTSICRNAFISSTQLASVTFPSNPSAKLFNDLDACSGYNINYHTSAPAWQFFNCRLTSITIPEGVTDIPEYFVNLNKLTSLTLPQSLQIIGEYAFGNNEIAGNLVIPKNVISVGTKAFQGNPFGGTLTTSLNSVTQTGEQLFASTNYGTPTFTKIIHNPGATPSETLMRDILTIGDDTIPIEFGSTASCTGASTSGASTCTTCLDDLDVEWFCKANNNYNYIATDPSDSTFDITVACGTGSYYDLDSSGNGQCKSCDRNSFQTSYGAVVLDGPVEFRHGQCCTNPHHHVCAKLLEEYQNKCSSTCPRAVV